MVSLVNYLGGEIDFKIVTTNYDLNSQKPYEGIQVNTWLRSPLGCEVYYADPKTLSRDKLTKIIAGIRFDKVYINSFFSKNFSIIPLQILNAYHRNKPVILAPRGMLGEGALAIKKFKKKAFILYSKLSGFHDRVIWHATSGQEAQEIRACFTSAGRIVQIANLPKKLNAPLQKSKSKGALRLCFISRISEKKNLLFALNILSGLKNEEICYNIYGPLEDEAYWKKCEDVIRGLPSNITVTYRGSINPAEIETVLATEHMMFLPTLNENFGHAIVESLMCGCPVIISDQTPWNDLENYQAGYALRLDDPEAFRSAIRHAVTLDQEAFSLMSRQAIHYISKKINLNEQIQHYKSLFHESFEN
jgi:glycosyltransferase involved in cell wall biosynthesis